MTPDETLHLLREALVRYQRGEHIGSCEAGYKLLADMADAAELLDSQLSAHGCHLPAAWACPEEM